MPSKVSLSQYVKKRTGVPLGASRSMRNMLARSLGAKSFPIFWHYWNPVWGYCLSRYVMKPLRTFLPISATVFITFLVSGALHDLAVSLLKWKMVVFFTPWFGLMGCIVIISGKTGITYGLLAWPIRASINLLLVFSSLGLMYIVEGAYA